LTEAEREYFGQVAPSGPTPEHREPLESYVARYVPDHPQSATCGTVGGRCGPTEEEAAAIEEEDAHNQLGALEFYASGMKGAVDDEHAHRAALPPATDSPAPASVKRSTTRPGTLPCEVCAAGVALAYIARTGRQRHGHHPDDAPSTTTLDFGEVSADD